MTDDYRRITLHDGSEQRIYVPDLELLEGKLTALDAALAEGVEPIRTIQNFSIVLDHVMADISEPIFYGDLDERLRRKYESGGFDPHESDPIRSFSRYALAILFATKIPLVDGRIKEKCKPLKGYFRDMFILEGTRDMEAIVREQKTSPYHHEVASVAAELGLVYPMNLGELQGIGERVAGILETRKEFN